MTDQQRPRQVSQSWTLVVLIALVVLSGILVMVHLGTHSAGTFEWFIDIGLVSLMTLTFSYGEWLRRHLAREHQWRQRLTLAQRAAGIGTWEHDLKTNSLVWSPESYRIFDMDAAGGQPLYGTFLALVHPKDRERLTVEAKRAFETGTLKPFRFRAVRGDGTLRVVQTCGRVEYDGVEPVRLVGTAEDVTDRAAAEEALRTSEERFQLAWVASHGVVWEWMPLSGDVWWSDGFERLFGHAETPARNTLAFWMDHIHPDDADRVKSGLSAFLETSERYRASEYRCRRADGSYVDVLDRGYLVRDALGRPVRMIGSLLDITDRKRAERLTHDFVSLATHQLRTPLSGISWMLELAIDEPSTQQSMTYVRDAHKAAERLARLVNDLLGAARLESGRMGIDARPLELGALTRAIGMEFEPRLRDRALELVVDSPDPVALEGDTTLIREAIENLLSNAVKYTPPGGCIAITIGKAREGYATWTIRDTGVGVPADARQRVFEKFFRASNTDTTDTCGSGLGLYLVKLIVERHGGRVWCDAAPGGGSSFAFTLPITPEAAAV